VLKNNAISPASAGLVAADGLVQKAKSDSPQRPASETSGRPQVTFERALEKAFRDADVKMSRHARERVQSRQIDLNSADVGRISDAIDALRGKGGKISLLLMGDTTFVTNVKNRTVITAVDRYGEADKVFTQIDSAAVIEKA
jgi:flagellar operon protein